MSAIAGCNWTEKDKKFCFGMRTLLSACNQLFARGWRTLSTALKPAVKPLLVLGLVTVLVFSQADAALAARSGGRIGGGSFRIPSRSFSSPSRTYQPGPRGGGYYSGGGFGFPFLIPFVGFGGGGLFSLLIFLAIAGFLARTFRNISQGGMEGSSGNGYSPTTISVAQLRVGLLASARELQTDLDKLARAADTNSSSGRAKVLQESTLALLRHPDYWVYADADSESLRPEAAEAVFNRLALTERSKFSAETLSNTEGQLRENASQALAKQDEAGDLAQLSGEYIVVTLVVGSLGKLTLPKVDTAESLRAALQKIGAISSEQLLAMEILWTPQAEGDTLAAEDLLTGYPELKRL